MVLRPFRDCYVMASSQMFGSRRQIGIAQIVKWHWTGFQSCPSLFRRCIEAVQELMKRGIERLRAVPSADGDLVYRARSSGNCVHCVVGLAADCLSCFDSLSKISSKPNRVLGSITRSG